MSTHRAANVHECEFTYSQIGGGSMQVSATAGHSLISIIVVVVVSIISIISITISQTMHL